MRTRTTWSFLAARERHPVVIDIALAMLFATATVITIFQQEVVEGYREPVLWDAVVGASAAVPIVFRRRFPLGALLTTCVLTTILVGSDAPEGWVVFTVALLTYSVAVHQPLRRSLFGIAAVVAMLVVLGLLGTPGLDSPFGVLSFSVLMASIFAGGCAMRARQRSNEAEMRAAAERAEAEIQGAARAVAEERLRIAQELHDVVAHSISVIAVQAGVGSHFLGDDGSRETREALDAIGDTSRATLGELRRLLGALRGDDGLRRHSPAPTLDQLPALIAQTRQLGVDVTLDQHGTSDGQHLAIEMSAYRIVQEALTNVIKHAGATNEVLVRVQQGPDRLELEITDDGRGAVGGVNGSSPPSGQHGLLGMRERVEMWGGSLTTGPRSGGGYKVAAVIPYGADE